jgi:small subunit ribosomal protein S20
MKTAVKALSKAIENKDKAQVQQTLSSTTSIIAKTASKGITKKTTASRKISRLTKKANTIIHAES